MATVWWSEFLFPFHASSSSTARYPQRIHIHSRLFLARSNGPLVPNCSVSPPIPEAANQSQDCPRWAKDGISSSPCRNQRSVWDTVGIMPQSSTAKPGPSKGLSCVGCKACFACYYGYLRENALFLNSQERFVTWWIQLFLTHYEICTALFVHTSNGDIW